MVKTRLITFLILLQFILFLPQLLLAQDLNELAYQNRYLLKAGTILNNEGKGDCLIFPYYDVREIDGINQSTEININNLGAYGIVAKLRVREWARGKEVFSKDIWIPSGGSWKGIIEATADGKNGIITSFDNVVYRYDGKYFYISNPLTAGVSFSTLSIRKNGGSSFYGYIEVIGEEKTAPEKTNGKVARLAGIERDCPNTLMGKAFINRVEEEASMTYDAVAIGNFSRGQGSLFRSTKSLYPSLETCEDTLDQLEFQLSKWQLLGSYSLNPLSSEKTSFIVTFPTKHFHYKKSNRINQINNPFEALSEITGETIKTTITEEGQLVADSTITLPFSVNVIGLYKDYYGSPVGIDNVSFPTYSSESGEVTFAFDNLAERMLISDYENWDEGRFIMYRGLPAVGVGLREARHSPLDVSITPMEYSTGWIPSNSEVVIVPTALSGPSSGFINVSYSFTTGGSSSSLGHPVEYQFDWGDGTTSSWGESFQSKAWETGGAFTVRARARCALHPDVVSHWSNGITIEIESVSAPSVLIGPTKGIPNEIYTYTASGAFSSAGHLLEYQFDWKGDATDLSSWGPASQTKAWAAGGVYTVRARARCATHLAVMSGWTSGLEVTIELISKPSRPVGPSTGSRGETYSFGTGGSESNIGDPVEYQFDWGDGTTSPWGPPTQTKSWSTYGDFVVKSRARCVTHPSVVSDWSDELLVIVELVTPPSQPTGQLNGMRGKPYTYTAFASVSTNGHSLEYQFDWGDGSTSPWAAATKDIDTGIYIGSQIKVWTSSGTYVIKARARCRLHPEVISDWSSGLLIVIEFASAPVIPSGPTSGTVGEGYFYVTGGSSVDTGNPVQYRFDWGDSTTSEWLPIGTTGVGKAWTSPGTYAVRAQARCTIHTEVVSDWSPVLSVTMVPGPPPQVETVSIPFIEDYLATPDRGSIYQVTANRISGRKDIPYEFGILPGVSNLRHAVEHQFDWGDGTFSEWGDVSAVGIKAWPVSGSYTIKVRARCVEHPTVISGWSSGLIIVIDYITPPSRPVWESAPVNNIGFMETLYTFSTGGSTSEIGQGIQYRFHWGDGTDSGWLPLGTAKASKIWLTQGTYSVRVDARGWWNLGATETLYEHFSYYSAELVVNIRSEETISTPDVPSGPTIGVPNTGYPYSTGGAASSLGHQVQYLFEWGDGTDSNWLPVGTTNATKSWPVGGTYTVRVRARCATDTLVVSEWNSLTVLIESISTPNTPVGMDTGIPGGTSTYMTGGATSNIGDPIEYQFDWKGDGSDLSPWGPTVQSKTWTTGGTYSVRARARCVTHPSIVSDWSSGLTVNIEVISTPSTPAGPDQGAPLISYTYSAGGATSNTGDPVQYRFDWGDGTFSGWLAAGVTSTSKVWSLGGTYTVRVQARCATHTSVVSEWSNGLTVTIETISTPNAPTGETNPVQGAEYTYTSGIAASSIDDTVEYQFDWNGDGLTDLSPWGPVTQSKTWTAAETYSVRSRARCIDHTNVISEWSDPLTVTVP